MASTSPQHVELKPSTSDWDGYLTPKRKKKIQLGLAEYEFSFYIEIIFEISIDLTLSYLHSGNANSALRQMFKPTCRFHRDADETTRLYLLNLQRYTGRYFLISSDPEPSDWIMSKGLFEEDIKIYLLGDGLYNTQPANIVLA